MCDPKKIWSALLNDPGFIEGTPNDESRELIRKELVEPTPALLAACLDKKCTLATLAEARCAIAVHMRDTDFMTKVLGCLPLDEYSDEDKAELLAEGREEMKEAAESALRAAQQALTLPSGGMTEDLVFTHHVLTTLQMNGVVTRNLTIREIVECYPSVLYAAG